MARDYVAAQNAARSTVKRIMQWRPDDVEDVLQDAVVRAIMHEDQYRGEAQFNTWFTSIAIRTALMRLRAGRTVQWCELFDVHEASGDDPMDSAVRAERSKRLHEAARSLPKSLREEFPSYLAGDICGVSEGRKGRRFRIRKRLREVLEGIV